MKRTLIAATLVALASLANAGTVATLPTQDGKATIRLTDDTWKECRDGEMMIVSLRHSGSFIRGCWKFIDEDTMVQARWVEGTGRTMVYDNDAFTLTEYGWKNVREFDAAEARNKAASRRSSTAKSL